MPGDQLVVLHEAASPGEILLPLEEAPPTVALELDRLARHAVDGGHAGANHGIHRRLAEAVRLQEILERRALIRADVDQKIVGHIGSAGSAANPPTGRRARPRAATAS